MGRRMAQAGTPCTLVCMKFQPMPRERSRRRIDDTMGKLAHCRAERPNGTSCWLASMMTVSRHPSRCGSVLRVGMRFACPFIAPKLGGHLTDLPHAGTPTGRWWCVFSIIPTHSFHTQTRTINDNPTPSSSDSELRLHPRAVQIHHKRLVPVGHKPAKEGALLGRALDDDA